MYAMRLSWSSMNMEYDPYRASHTRILSSALVQSCLK